MNVWLKRIALGACGIVMMSTTVVSEAPLRLGFFRTAEAIIGIAPGGSILRRRAIIGTAAVTTAAVASSTANASAAAAANANAAAANAKAAAAKAPPPAGPPPVGAVVAMLPPGCASTVLNGVEYHRCGDTYYQAAMQGNNLVYVVKQP
jgi:hypothetical protein